MTSSAIRIHISLPIFCNYQNNEDISQISNYKYIYMTSPAIYINILSVHFWCLFNSLKIMGRTDGEIWFVQDAIDCLLRIEIIWDKNLQGTGHELLTNGKIDHKCWVSKPLWVGLVRVIFGVWLGDFRNYIFINTIDTVWYKNLSGMGHALEKLPT